MWFGESDLSRHMAQALTAYLCQVWAHRCSRFAHFYRGFQDL